MSKGPEKEPTEAEKEVQKLWEELQRLRRGREDAGRPIASIANAAGMQGSKHENIRDRLKAEVEFYRSLYGRHKGPGGGVFEVTYLPTKHWNKTAKTPLAWMERELLQFSSPPGTPLAVVRFDANPRYLNIEYFQGERDAAEAMSAATEALGRPWYEVFMDHIIKSFDPLHRQGVKLWQVSPHESETVPLKIRDRYFTKEHDTTFIASQHGSTRHALNFRKKRVRELLKPG